MKHRGVGKVVKTPSHHDGKYEVEFAAQEKGIRKTFSEEAALSKFHVIGEKMIGYASAFVDRYKISPLGEGEEVTPATDAKTAAAAVVAARCYVQ